MPKADRNVNGFLRELRRRRVFRTAGLYVVGGWLLIQVADVFFPAWGLPDEAINDLLIGLVALFPLVLVFGWFFDITTLGLKRTLPAADGVEPGGRTLERSDYGILAGLAVPAALVLAFVVSTVLGPAEPPLPDASQYRVAVLPFLNISADPDNEYFCDGISEEIRNHLAGFGELEVIARRSSEAFKGSDVGIAQIAALLGVRYLLQGSVRKHGDDLRISAQLVDAGGVQKWQQDFDRRLENVFEIQKEIAEAVVDTIAPWVSHVVGTGYEPDVDTYLVYLRGREALHQRDVTRAIEYLDKAIDIDPKLAVAHADLGIALLIGNPGRANLDRAAQLIDTALELSPGLPRALAAKGLYLQQKRPPDNRGALKALYAALEAEPNMVDAINWLSNPSRALGEGEDPVKRLERALVFDPLHPVVNLNLSQHYADRGELERAEQTLLTVLEVPRPPHHAFMGMRDLLRQQGRLAELNAIAKGRSLRHLDMHYDLILSYALFGMWDEADYWSRRTREEVPADYWFKAFFTMLVPFFRGRYDEAARLSREILESRGEPLEDLDSRVRWWNAEVRALAGDCDGAAVLVGDTLELLRGLFGEDDDAYRAAHALAWSCRGGPREAAALDLLRDIEASWQARLQEVSYTPSLHKYLMAQNALLLGDRELALERLGAAVDAGWREYYFHTEDPRLDDLRDDPRFNALMAEVKADVDRQRAEVEERDAERDFIAELDAARANRE
jgi:TolB-like protein/Tfp pilus assembly protein PilF